MLTVNFPSSFWNESEQSRFIQQFGRPRHATPPYLPLHCTADRAPVELKRGREREGGREWAIEGGGLFPLGPLLPQIRPWIRLAQLFTVMPLCTAAPPLPPEPLLFFSHSCWLEP